MEKEMKKFIEKVLGQFVDDITDKVFLMIQNDSKLMEDYLGLLDRHKGNIDLNTLNSNIGKHIKECLNLDNINESKEPKSTLIQTFTRHKIKSK